MVVCEIVKKHKGENDGKTDLVWLKEHSSKCDICQQILVITNALISDMINLDNLPDGDEDKEHPDTQYS